MLTDTGSLVATPSVLAAAQVYKPDEDRVDFKTMRDEPVTIMPSLELARMGTPLYISIKRVYY